MMEIIYENSDLSSPPVGRDMGINILMTGGGAPGAAGIINCLVQEPSFHVTVADANPGSVGRWLCKDFVLIPPAKNNDFIKVLLAVCQKKKIQILLPLVTKELLPLSESVNEFEKIGCKVIVTRCGEAGITPIVAMVLLASIF